MLLRSSLSMKYSRYIVLVISACEENIFVNGIFVKRLFPILCRFIWSWRVFENFLFKMLKCPFRNICFKIFFGKLCISNSKYAYFYRDWNKPEIKTRPKYFSFLRLSRLHSIFHFCLFSCDLLPIGLNIWV
jgi:hypothetical protein